MSNHPIPVPAPSHVLDYYVVDVFTTSPLSGNPLAVVMNTTALTTAQMQTIAREFNLSETTFVERRPAAVEAAEGVRVRIFTTAEELPFAGHPTLGTASVLRLTAPEVMHDSVITLAENIGPIPVRFPDSGGLSLEHLRQSAPPQAAGGLSLEDLHQSAPPQVAGSLFAEMTQRDPEFGATLDPAEVARLCGLPIDDLLASSPSQVELAPPQAPQVVSTGNGFAIVLLRSIEALGRLRVIQDEATAWLRAHSARWFYVLAAEDQNGARCFRARMQFNGGEDPATGSAAGCAVSYLVKHNLAPSGERFLIRQGIEMGRPSEIFVSAQASTVGVTDIRVAGSTVLVAKGTLFLP